MKKLPLAKRAAILQCLCEGVSVASTTRITGAAKHTILDLLVQAGEACAAYMDSAFVNLPCERVELDEIWSFVGHKNQGKDNQRDLIHDPKSGDVWTWKCVCSDTKLIVSYHVGGRTFENATAFCRGFAHRFANVPQISTDGLKSYPLAIKFAFGDSTPDYGRLIKLYGKDKEGKEVCIGARKERVSGQPDMERTCTSFVERSNLTLRMQNRRFARKTNAHSRVVENHEHMLALGFFHFNFARKHQSLKQTPAQAAGVAGHRWTMEEMAEMIEDYRQEQINAAFEAAFENL